jgi:predicted outer membrane protein
LKTSSVQKDKEDVQNTFLPKPAGALVAGTLAALSAVLSATAQTGGGGEAAPSSPPPPQAVSASELTSHFVATAVPTTNFIATASRMAISKSRNAKIQQFAGPLAKDQSAIANSLSAWVNVNGPVVTLRSPYTGQIGVGAPKLKAPNLLPAQVASLQRLSASSSHDFDALFVSAQMEALVQLQILYRDFIQNGTDPGLHAIAERELPKVEQTISALDSL